MKEIVSKFHIILFFISSLLWGQIRLIELPQVSPNIYFSAENTSEYYSFDSDWMVYKSNRPDKRINLDLPAVFDKEEDFVFEKEFELSPNLKGKYVQLHILGLNYTADFKLNDIVIYRHTGGEFPFKVHLPNNLLNYDSKNVLKINVHYFEDSKVTIPLAQKFLFPKNRGGFLRDIYLEITSPISFDKISESYSYNYKRKSTEIDFSLSLLFEEELLDSLNTKEYKIGINIFDGETNLTKDIFPVKLSTDTQLFKTTIHSIVEWSPQSPKSLKAEFVIFDNENILHKKVKYIHPHNFSANDNGLEFNGKKFSFKAVTFVPLESDDKLRTDYYDKQIRLIKEEGFNAVRFSKVLPDPYILKKLNEIGLLALVDIPIDGVPETLTEKNDFIKRVTTYAEQTISYYSGFDCVIAFGLGSSYLKNSVIHKNFLEILTGNLRNSTDKLFYASFINRPEIAVNGLDLYGVQYFVDPVTEIIEELSESESDIPAGRLFISEITYPSMYGNSNGYLNQYTVEAQSKYFADLISKSKRNGLNGYFINSMYNYSGNVSSLFGGYSDQKEYSIGLQKSPDSPLSFTLKVIKSKLTGDGKINIPLGTKDDRSPIFFVVIALVLAIIMGILVNTKRKFREDATRALLRSYNFYADIRDHRILSGVHTFILMIIIAGSYSLLWTVLLYFLRMNILFEKIILAFDVDWLTNAVSYLAWNPSNTFIICFILSILGFVLLSVVIKTFSIFVKQRILFSNIYFVVVWSFLPLLLLLPLELILHKVLLLNLFNLYIYIILAIFLIWFTIRLLRGIYVIFDVTPSTVYFFSFLFLLTLSGIMIIYFHFANNSFYYLVNAFKQHPLI